MFIQRVILMVTQRMAAGAWVSVCVGCKANSIHIKETDPVIRRGRLSLCCLLSILPLKKKKKRKLLRKIGEFFGRDLTATTQQHTPLVCTLHFPSCEAKLVWFKPAPCKQRGEEKWQVLIDSWLWEHYLIDWKKQQTSTLGCGTPNTKTSCVQAVLSLVGCQELYSFLITWMF